jgi:L-arabonate dehydrase
VFSPGESALRPTAMMYRNLAAMDVEEALRANPIDGVVLLGRLRQDHAGAADGRGQRRYSGHRRLRRSDAQRLVPRRTRRLRHRALADERGGQGRHDDAGTSSWRPSRRCRAAPGHCNTMGTASTMASMAEALGMALSGNAAIPAVDSRRRVMAHLSGRRIVDMVKDDLKPSDILTGRPSRTPSAPMARSAARPMPSSTCWRSPAASAST